MKDLRRYIRQIILESMEINNPEIQKLLAQIRQASEMDSETVNSFMEMLSLLMETEDLAPGEVEAIRNEIKGLIAQSYSKGRNFENVRSALSMGASLGFHPELIESPRTPGGFGFTTGGTEMKFSSAEDASKYVSFLESIGMDGFKTYEDIPGKWDTHYLYTPGESIVMIWN